MDPIERKPASVIRTTDILRHNRPMAKFVSICSDEYKQFVKRLVYNYEEAEIKLHACLYCWAFITPEQKKRHMEHNNGIANPSFF